MLYRASFKERRPSKERLSKRGLPGGRRQASLETDGEKRIQIFLLAGASNQSRPP